MIKRDDFIKNKFALAHLYRAEAYRTAVRYAAGEFEKKVLRRLMAENARTAVAFAREEEK